MNKLRTILVFLLVTSMFMTNFSTAQALQPVPSGYHGTTNVTGNLPCGTDSTLVGCWQMEENGGPVLEDGSSYVNDATLFGAPTWAAGVDGGYAIDLNGTSQYAQVLDNSSLDIADQITILAWIRPEQYATQDLIKKATQGSVNGYELTLATTKSDASSQRVFFRINQVLKGDTYRINAVTMYPIDGTWMHVAATYDGSTMRLYINGVEEATLTLPAGTKIELNDVPLSIGAQSTPTRYFKGWIDDARVYRRALSPEEIQAFINFPPVAVDDTYGTPEDTLLSVSAPGVLSNDTDVDLDPLTAIKVTDPAHGLLTLNADGSFTYDPEDDWSGVDSFTYKANDTHADSNTATVTLTVSEVNDPPVVTDIPDQAIGEGASFASINLDDYVSDVDNTDAQMSWSYSDNTALTVNIVDRVATVTIPGVEWSGSETITFRATDPGGLWDEDAATFTVTTFNEAPILNPIGPKSTDELALLQFTATATDIDVPADTLTFNLADGSSGSVPDGAGIDSTSGDFSWTPTETQGPGTYTFDVCVSDGLLFDCETITVTVSEVNTSPVAVPDAYTIIENRTLTVSAPGVLTNDSDADIPADTLTAILVSGTTHGSLTFNADGSFTYNPAAMWSGIDTFTYKVYDGTGYSEVVSVTITVKLLIYYILIFYK
jgi:VCBS repeat-containing protein